MEAARGRGDQLRPTQCRLAVVRQRAYGRLAHTRTHVRRASSAAAAWPRRQLRRSAAAQASTPQSAMRTRASAPAASTARTTDMPSSTCPNTTCCARSAAGGGVSAHMQVRLQQRRLSTCARTAHLAVEPRRGNRGDEELRVRSAGSRVASAASDKPSDVRKRTQRARLAAVGVGPAVGHGQDARALRATGATSALRRRKRRRKHKRMRFLAPHAQPRAVCFRSSDSSANCPP
jgi:hypothetical protein